MAAKPVEVTVVDEEVVLLEEQLAAAHGDIERLQARLAEAEALASGREQESANLRRQLEASNQALSASESAVQSQTAEAETLRVSLEDANVQAREAISRYRTAVLAQEPELPADLISGETVEAIDAALTQARQTVAQVRQHLEQQAQALRVPPGAPARAGPDVSSLSPADKIRLGLEQK
jgi:chromosome segregation ATPase